MVAAQAQNCRSGLVFAMLLALMTFPPDPAVAQDRQENFPILEKREKQSANGREYQIVAANGIKAVIAAPGDRISRMAADLGYPADDVRDFNDLDRNEDMTMEGHVYYLYPKYEENRNADFHIAERGESLWHISQRYAIELKELAKRNRMDEQETPQLGRVIYLNERRRRRDPIETKPADLVPNTPSPAERLAPKPEPVISKVNATAADKAEQVQQAANKPAQMQQAILNDPTKDTANFYIVKPNENIMAVQANTGVPIAKIQELNPEVDFFKPLAPGQALRIKPQPAPAKVEAYEGLDKPTVRRRTHLVSKDETVAIIAAKYRVSEADIYAWNQIQPGDVQPGMYLFVEGEKKSVGEAPASFNTPTAEEQLAAANNGQYIFMPGDTEAQVAKAHNISVNDLRKWNNICPGQKPKPGDRLYITSFAVPVGYMKDCPEQVAVANGQSGGGQPASMVNAAQNNPAIRNTGSTTASRRPTPPAAEAKPKYHTVAAGDGLWSISKKYDTTVDQLRAWNNLPNNEIRKGEKLIVGYRQSPLTKAPQGQVAKFHKIQKGETVWRISKKYSLDLNKLREMNGMQSDHIVAGFRLFVGYEPGLPQYHDMGPGETIKSISESYKLLPSYIRKINGLEPGEEASPGQKLRLK